MTMAELTRGRSTISPTYPIVADLPRAPSTDLVDALRPFAAEHSAPAGASLCDAEHRPCGAFYIVARGEAELRYQTTGERLVLDRFHRGSLFGDLCGDGNIPAPFATVAMTDVSLLMVDLTALIRLGQRQPQIWLGWAGLATAQLARVQRRLVALTSPSAAERLTRYLLVETEGQEWPVLHVTQEILASRLGLSRQTVSRVLGQLERHGAIEHQRGELWVSDRARLLAFIPG